MKKILFILAVTLVLAMHLMAQDSLTVPHYHITMLSDTGVTDSAYGVWHKRGAISTVDSMHNFRTTPLDARYFSPSTGFIHDEAGWYTAVLQYDSVRIVVQDPKTGSTVLSANYTKNSIYFRIPPKHIVLDGSSYTPMFLSGKWFLLMDPQQ